MSENLVLSNQLASPSLSNLLVNGGFEIWQRGAGAFTANSAFTADRWQNSLSGTDGLSVSKDTSNQDANSAACAACTFTLGTPSGAATCLAQYLEDFKQMQGQTLSLSVRVKCSTANAARLFLYAGVSRIESAYHPGDGAYHTLTVTTTAAATLPSVSGGIQAGVEFAASCTAYIDNAMLIVGSTPVAYVPLTPADEMQRCQRYYEIIPNPAGSSNFNWWDYGAAASSPNLPIPIALKAVTPTVTLVGTWSVTNTAQPASFAGGTNLIRVQAVPTALGMFNVASGNAGNCITVEANP